MKITVKNPLTKTYQYEYALFTVISGMFAGVECRSRCIETLRLYFNELPNAEKREGVLESVRRLVEKDLEGRILFPMMNLCRADVHVREAGDGTHIFTFTDGIYGFEAHIVAPTKKNRGMVEVRC